MSKFHNRFLFVLCTLTLLTSGAGARTFEELDEDVQLPVEEMKSGTYPQAGVEGRLVNQSSSKGFDVHGMRGGGYGRVNLGEGTSLGLRGGKETYWKGKESRDGWYAGVFGQYALNSQVSLRADIAHHGVVHEPWVGNLTGLMQYGLRMWRAGVKRELIYDSYDGLLGIQVGPRTWIGAARRNVGFVGVAQDFGSVKVDAEAFAGWTSARQVRDNRLVGADAKLTYRFGQNDDGHWSLASRTQVWGYQRDGSFGGYFSPSMFFSEGALLGFQKTVNDDSLLLELGPAYQYITGTTVTKKSQLGAQGTLAVTRRVNKEIRVQLQVEYERLANLYQRAQGMVWVHHQF